MCRPLVAQVGSGSGANDKICDPHMNCGMALSLQLHDAAISAAAPVTGAVPKLCHSTIIDPRACVRQRTLGGFLYQFR